MDLSAHQKRACDLANQCETHHLSSDPSIATGKLERRFAAATTTSLSSILNTTTVLGVFHIVRWR
jgi:hypothetical protein